MKLSKVATILEGLAFFDKENNFDSNVEIWAEAGSDVTLIMLSPDRKTLILADADYARDYLWEAGEDINTYKILYEEK